MIPNRIRGPGGGVVQVTLRLGEDRAAGRVVGKRRTGCAGGRRAGKGNRRRGDVRRTGGKEWGGNKWDRKCVDFIGRMPETNSRKDQET